MGDEEDVQASPFVRRQEAEEEEVQAKTRINRQEPEEEEIQPSSLLQRQESEEKEKVQTKKNELSAVILKQNEVPENQEEGEIQTTLNGESSLTVQKQSELNYEEETLKSKNNSGSSSDITPETEAKIMRQKGGGQPLSDSTRAFFEPRFGNDFSSVRVHTDHKADESAKSINAQAYTSGNDIVFSQGRYSPDTESGKRLLGHELTHVVQQDENRTKKNFSSDIKRQTKTSSSTVSKTKGNSVKKPYPPVYWSLNRAQTRVQVIPKPKVTLGEIAKFLYGIEAAKKEIAAVNKISTDKPIAPGIPLTLPKRQLSKAAYANMKASPKIPAEISDPAAFLCKKGELDRALVSDFKFVVSKLDEAHYSDEDEDQVISILRKWGNESFTLNKRLYPKGGQYLDKLFSMLQRKRKDVGTLTTQWTNYYSLIFNHFDKVNEVISIRDKHSRLYKGDRGFKELSFGSFFWNQVKEGKVRDQIFAYFKGLGKGIWSGAKGTVMMVYTLVTDPKKFWSDLKKLPSALKAMWENRSELWRKFTSASPEEQAEMIGKIFGEIEFMIASAAGGGAAAKGVEKLTKVPGAVGKIAKGAQVVTKLPQTALGVVAKGVSTVVIKGVGIAVKGAIFAARGIYRVAGKILRGTWSVVQRVFGKVLRKIYYFFDEAAGLLRKIPEKFARNFCRCSICRLLKTAIEPKKIVLIEKEVIRIRKLVRKRLRKATKRLEKKDYPKIFKDHFTDFPGGRLWQIHHELEQMFRLIFKRKGVSIDELKYLRGVQTIGKKHLEKIVKKHVDAWKVEFQKIYGRKPTAREINRMRLKTIAGAEETANLHNIITRQWEDWFNNYLDSKILEKVKKGEKIIPDEVLPSAEEIINQANFLNWKYEQFYWDVRKAFGLPVVVK